MLTKPLTKKQVRDMLNSEGALVVDIAVTLEELFEGIEAVNNIMDERVLKSGLLSDISYQVVGSVPPTPDTYIGGEVILRVTAHIDDI